MLIAHDTLIMVLDGARMSLFRNSGIDRAPKLELLAEAKHQVPATSELGDDRPGREFQSSGTRRGAYETPDLHQKEEDEFAAEMAELFNFHMVNSERRAILIAPPRALGAIRKHLHPDARSALVAEIDKDYAGRTALEVAELLDRYEN